MAEPVIETPPPAPVIANPVIQPDLELSKSIFREEMDKVKPPTETPVETPEPEKVEKPTSKEGKPATEPPATEKPASKVPEELLSGDKPTAEGKVDDAIAQIDAMVLPKNAKPEQVASFGKLKEAAKKEIEAKLARISELEGKQSDGATKAEIEAAQERVKTAETRAKELEATVERLAFTESPKFKAFAADETASLSGAKSYLEGTDINPEIIEVAARTIGPKRIQVLKDAGADSEVIAAVAPYLAQYDSIQRNKASALENWKTDAAQYDAAQKAQAEAMATQRKSEEDKVWNSVISKARNEVVPYRKFEKNEDWNKRSDELESQAKKIFNGDNVSLDTVADVIAKGVAYDALDEVRIELTNQNRELRQENAKLKSARPSGGTTQGNGITTQSTENLSAEERAKRTFNQEMARVTGGVT